jgi:hypothetical protein
MFTWCPWIPAAAVVLVAASALGAENFGSPFPVDGNTLGLWHFDESPGGNTAFDATANANHAIIDPNAVDPFGDGYGPLDPGETWAPGLFGQGLHTWLTSVPDQNIGTLIVPQDPPGQGNSSLFVSGDFSIEFWINAGATSPGSWEDYILSKGTGAPYNLRYDQNRLEFGWYSGGWQNVIDPTVIPLNQWHHVAVTVDSTSVPGSSVVTFYIDGSLTSQHTVNPVQDFLGQSDHNLYIFGPDNGHPFNCFQGRLDELRISDSVRAYGDPGEPGGSWWESAEWYDAFYQYRIPFEVTVPSAGQSVLNLSVSQIVQALDALSPVPHSEAFFDYNQVEIVAYDDQGGLVGPVSEAGFYLSDVSGEWVVNGSFEASNGMLPAGWGTSYPESFSLAPGLSHDGSQCVRVSSTVEDKGSLFQWPFAVTQNNLYLLTFWAKSAQVVGNATVNFIYNGTQLETSYIPRMYASDWAQYERMFRPEISGSLDLIIYRTIIGEAFVDDVSAREVRIDLLLDAAASGPQQYMLYCQPMETTQLIIPEKRVASLPPTAAAPTWVGEAQLSGCRARHRVTGSPEFDVWFAETTEKITPDLAPPSALQETVEIAAARNERQSFQLVIRARTNMNVSAASLGPLTSGADTIPANQHRVRIADYATMSQPSSVAVSLVPRIADMLVDFGPRSLTATGDNLAVWFTIDIDEQMPPGTYVGEVVLDGDAGGSPFSLAVPLRLKVHRFALPDKVTFRSAFDGQYFALRYGTNNIYDFHGVSTPTDEAALVRAYYDEMCANRINPYNVTYPHGVSYQWNPPPQGYGVDAPGNHFTLHSFDFTVVNAALSHFVDTRHANSFLFAATNGKVIDQITLPGNFAVAWDDPQSGATAITKDQYDNLILDYYEAWAANLIANGWIDYAFILCDESQYPDYPKIQNFIDVLASSPTASMIPLLYTINTTSAFTWRENPATNPVPILKDRLGIWAAENDARGFNYNEEYYFTDYGTDPGAEEIWSYYTRSPHLNIDSHGLNNRCMPVKNYFMGSRGFLDWACFIYELPEFQIQNPRVDAYGEWGNGATAWFYPPDTVPSASPDFTITPSARLEMLREGVEDYEYLVILDETTAAAEGAGIDTTAAAGLKAGLKRMMASANHWSVNSEQYLTLRGRILEEIDKLNWYVAHGLPAAGISAIDRSGQDMLLQVDANPVYQYTLYRMEGLIEGQGQPTDTRLIDTNATVQFVDSNATMEATGFYGVGAEIP